MLTKHKQILYYGIASAALIFLLRWLELRLLVFSHALEFYIGAIAVIFTTLGIWLATKLARPKTIVVEREKPSAFLFNVSEYEKTNISKRELEVLELMARGMSNNEIATELFVSLNTVKSHGARLFEKLEVSRRTQAVEKAKRLGLIP